MVDGLDLKLKMWYCASSKAFTSRGGPFTVLDLTILFGSERLKSWAKLKASQRHPFATCLCSFRLFFNVFEGFYHTSVTCHLVKTLAIEHSVFRLDIKIVLDLAF